MTPHIHLHARKRGSALSAALILALAVSLGLAGLIQWSQTERQLTQRHTALAKARMTAESVAQYGAAQIKARLEQVTYFPDDEFRPGRNPPAMPEKTLLQGIIGTVKGTGGGGGIGGLLGNLLGNGGNLLGNGKQKSEADPDTTSSPASGYFRYEITPENLVIGRFEPARWEKAEASNPLYVGDPLIDQTVRVREVRMVSAARAVHLVHRTTTMAYCEQYLQVRDSPVWGNMLFYNLDLEIAPGPGMEIHGPVHTNGNLYVQSGASLHFHAIVSSAGQLHHGRAPGGGSTSDGEVTFKKNGTASEFVSLKQNGAWLDSGSENWVSKASTLWAGNVRTREHGINPAIPAGMAPYVPDDPATPDDELQNSARAVIEAALPTTDAGFPGNEVEVQKFASKACLVLEVSSAGAVSLYKYSANASGTYVRDVGFGPQTFSRSQLTVPAGLIVGGVAADRFHDARRGSWVSTADLDIGELKTLIETSGAAAAFTRGSVTFNPATEWNGIVFVSHANTTRGGVRLVNGGTIPNRPTGSNGYTAGLTVATNAPLYIQGHYNANGHIAADGDLIRQPDSADEPPAGFAADAVTILSAGWTDANSNLALANRRAQQTEVSAAMLTGLVPTNKNGNGIYSGGVENLPRFLENWSGVKFGYRGSMVVMFESEIATQPWGSSNVYSPPDRVWGFNTLFASGILPPGTPNSRTYRRIGFRDLNESQYRATLDAINRE